MTEKATLALPAEAHSKIAFERLGHANIALSEEAACRVTALVLPV